MTSRSAALRAAALLAAAALAAPAAAAPRHQHHAARPGAHAHHHHGSRTAHPNRPAHPGHPKHHAGAPQHGRHGQHGSRSNLPVSYAPAPKLHVPASTPPASGKKVAALWSARAPRTAQHGQHARSAPSWLIAIPAGAVAVLAAGGLVRFIRTRRHAAPAAG